MPLYKGVPLIQDSVILASAKPGRSFLLASNTSDPISLYPHNVANAESG